MPNASSPEAAAYGRYVAGLVLTGGRSLRMGRDKAGLQHDGRTQLAHTHALLAPLVAHCHVSAREDQRDDPLRSAFACIVDQVPGLGPAAGILAAHAHDPDAAWLVVACDLPLLDPATLAQLIQARAPDWDAAAYRDPVSGRPEPLCAVWEPSGCRILAQAVAQGRNAPAGALQHMRTRWLLPGSSAALGNANTPEDFARMLTSAAASGRD